MSKSIFNAGEARKEKSEETVFQFVELKNAIPLHSSRLAFLFSRPVGAPVRQHAPHELGGVQTVGAAGGAQAAAEAVFDALHLLRPCGRSC